MKKIEGIAPNKRNTLTADLYRMALEFFANKEVK
jgi:hypothetical protein